MMRFIQYKKVIGLALAALTFTACTDKWDDHYTDAPLAGANEGTLWQAIQQNPELSNFSRVAKACDFHLSLQSSQMFSVFAPTNAQFTSEQADSVISLYNAEKAAGVRTTDNRAIKEFLQNHIARYTHSVASTTRDSIIMMNGKYVLLSNDTFGNQQVLSSNNLYENGVLFTLAHPLEYHPNVFEYMRTDSDVDSLASFLYDSHFFRYELNENLSVPGGIVDGRTVYLDSVMDKENELFYMLGLIDSEDSAYWMLAPTNERWAEMIEEYTPYFNYCDNVDKRDSLVWAMPRLAIARGTVFSLNTNTALYRHTQDNSVVVDSVMSTNAVSYSRRTAYWGNDSLAYYQYSQPFAKNGIFDGVEYEQCSNGMVLKADKWNVRPEQTFMHEIRVEAERANTIIDETTTLKNLSTVRVQSDNPFYNQVSGHQYLEIQPKNGRSDNPIIIFDVPNVLSNVPYDIFVVTAPALAGDTLADALQRRPTIVHVACFYSKQDGSAIDVRSLVPGDDRLFDYELPGRGDYEGFYESSADQVDTICVGSKIKFPTSSYGLSEAQVRLYLGSDCDINTEGDIYSRVLRIDCIILRPHLEATDEQ